MSWLDIQFPFDLTSALRLITFAYFPNLFYSLYVLGNVFDNEFLIIISFDLLSWNLGYITK